AEGLRSSGRVWAIERLAIAAGESLALLSSWLPAARFPGLGAVMRESRSLYSVLQQRYGVAPARADTTIEVGRCTTGQAALLGVPAGSAVLVARGTAVDLEETPVERFQVLYRGDRVRLQLAAQLYAENVIQDAGARKEHP